MFSSRGFNGSEKPEALFSSGINKIIRGRKVYVWFELQSKVILNVFQDDFGMLGSHTRYWISRISGRGVMVNLHWLVGQGFNICQGMYVSLRLGFDCSMRSQSHV